MEKIAIYLPVVAALTWGITYALVEKIFEHISVATWILTLGIVYILTAFAMGPAGISKIDIQPILNKHVLGLFIFLIIVSRIADLSTFFAIKHVNATYASIGEIAYVLFVPIVSYLVYGYRNFNNATLIGGLLVIAGVMVIIRGQYLESAAG